MRRDTSDLERDTRSTFLSYGAFEKKSDHPVDGRPGVRLMSRCIQSLTALVQRSSLYRMTCSAHLIFDFLA
ncbi:unnamed protein product [Haemonchus placei]|uniref:Uncharacterized protein n=1 Tax=Haemonchus placei TaxID=6290 RepID=A0A0N4X2J5_HAEPC|nr:unnamed protein product [Haemonchus placei]